MNKQTAVEWLISQIELGLSDKGMKSAFQQAIEMEKQQKMNDFIAGMEFIAVDPNRYKEDAEQYYNQTYGGGEQ
jgi:hypothetical protein